MNEWKFIKGIVETNLGLHIHVDVDEKMTWGEENLLLLLEGYYRIQMYNSKTGHELLPPKK